METLPKTSQSPIGYNGQQLKKFEVLVQQKIEVHAKLVNGLKDEIAELQNPTNREKFSIENYDVSLTIITKKRVLDSAAHYLRKLEFAMNRINNKRFGVCSVSGNLIPEEELERQPTLMCCRKFKK